MSYNIGLNVIEVDGQGAPAIAGAATSVAAFNIVTRRGIPNAPARINSFPEFVARFGNHFAGGLGSYMVKGGFDNGMATAYINRVIAAGTTVASRTLQDSGPANTVTLQGGYRGAPDPGSWARDLYVRTERRSVFSDRRLAETAVATVTAPAALPAATDMVVAAFPDLVVTIDGQAVPTTISFVAGQFANAAAATRAELVDAINAGTTDLQASLSPADEIILTSTGNIATLSGGFTSLSVAVNATYGFNAVTAANGTPAALNAGGTVLHNVDGLKPGDAIELSDGATTEQTKLISVNALNGAVTWSPDLAAPGAFALPTTRLATLEFDLFVHEGNPDEDPVESHLGLSMETDVANYVVAQINDPLQGSTFIRAVDAASPTSIGEDRPADLAAPVQFDSGGNDAVPTAADFIGDQAAGTGFFAFDPFDVQLITSERTDPAIASAGIAYCEGRDDCMYLGSVPEAAIQAGTAIAYGQALMGAKRYGALYGPWLTVADPIGVGENPIKLVPPTGHVIGVYARIEQTRGIWKAPAGDGANIRGVLDVNTRFSEARHTQLVKEGAINGIRAIPRKGIVIDASRTLSSDSRWLFVNVRLLFNFVKSSLRDGLSWVRQEPNREQLWNLVKYDSVTPFLMQLWRQGAFGTGGPGQTFQVIVDESNNPPGQVQLGFLNVEIYFYPSVPAETIVVKVGQTPAGGVASDG